MFHCPAACIRTLVQYSYIPSWGMPQQQQQRSSRQQQAAAVLLVEPYGTVLARSSTVRLYGCVAQIHTRTVESTI
jgi:hypothetical protein